jgi:hypothetical protein
MRVIFLRKKLELITDASSKFRGEDSRTSPGENITVYHGTSLANLYLIARDRKLGSPVGFTHKNVSEMTRDGVFYITIQQNYAYTAAYDWASRSWPPALRQWLAEWRPNQTWIDQIQQLSEGEITYDRISKIVGINDVFELYLTMWALAQAIRPGYLVPDAASVVLEIVMSRNFLRSEAFVDEDVFIWWFAWKSDDVTNTAMKLALNNEDFRSWIKETTGLNDEEINSKSYIELSSEVARKGYPKEFYIRMYRALREMAENGPYQEDARNFLRGMIPFSDSFFFSRQLSFDEGGIKAITAEIITKWGEIEKIDLLNDNEALDKIKEIMKRGVEWYAKYIREEATKERLY